MYSKVESLVKKIIPKRLLSYAADNWGVHGVRRYAKNATWMFIGQTATILSFIVNIIIARSLGPETFGTLNYVIAFAGIFAFIAQAGLSEALPRDLARSPEKTKEITGSSALILSIAAILSWCVTIAGAFLFEADTGLRLLIALCATAYLWLPINTIISSFFLANVQSKQIALAQIGALIAISLLRLSLLAFTDDVMFFVATFAIEPGLTAIGYFWRGRRHDLWHIRLEVDHDTLRHLISSGVLLMLSSALTYLLLRIDQVMMKSFVSEEAVGHYAAAVRLSEVWYFIPNLLCAALLPALVNAERTDHSQYHSRLQHLYAILFIAAAGIAAGTTLLANWLIGFLYGVDYLSAVPILVVYAWSCIGFFLATGVSKQLLVEHQLVRLLILNAVAVAVNIGLNLILIPSMGPVGAAWATLTAYTIVPLLHLFTYKKKPEPAIV